MGNPLEAYYPEHTNGEYYVDNIFNPDSEFIESNKGWLYAKTTNSRYHIFGSFDSDNFVKKRDCEISHIKGYIGEQILSVVLDDLVGNFGMAIRQNQRDADKRYVVRFSDKYLLKHRPSIKKRNMVFILVKLMVLLSCILKINFY